MYNLFWHFKAIKLNLNFKVLIITEKSSTFPWKNKTYFRQIIQRIWILSNTEYSGAFNEKFIHVTMKKTIHLNTKVSKYIVYSVFIDRTICVQFIDAKSNWQSIRKTESLQCLKHFRLLSGMSLWNERRDVRAICALFLALWLSKKWKERSVFRCFYNDAVKTAPIVRQKMFS